jgi:hypothetical protein
MDTWLKKYLLMYVFVTKTESGGRFWRVLFNRLVFATILANCVIALVVKARGTWMMVYALAPLPFLMLGFKWYCARTFDDDCQYYNRGTLKDLEGMAAAKKGKKSDHISVRFGHPALYKPLPTPMVHAKAVDALKQIYRGRLGSTAGDTGEYSDIAMQSMSTSRPGMPAQSSNAPFEVVAENQLDFAYYKNRADFRDEFGGGIYGKPEDLVSERSHTPKSFMGAGNFSPSSSRPSSRGSSVDGRQKLFDAVPGRIPSNSDHPAYRSPDSRNTSITEVPTLYHHSNESESRLLNNAQGVPVGSGPPNDMISLDRWRTDHPAGYGLVQQDDPTLTSYDYYRGHRP